MYYAIMYKGEEVDSADTRKEAYSLRGEYNMAFGGGCTIKQVSYNREQF